MTILEALNWATDYLRDCGIDHPRLNAELLLARSIHLSREELYIRLHDQVMEEEIKTLEGLSRRRGSGEPLQYILGHQEFWSIDLKVDPRVLIPRPDTERLVEESLSILAKISSKKIPSVLELGTGSGAIAISLAKEVKNIFLVATDLSGDALMVAKENAKQAGVSDKIGFVKGDLLSPFHQGETFDLILSNPPYISDSEISDLSREVRDHEPLIALNGGKDGLEFYRKLISQAPYYLEKEGWFLLEVGSNQASSVSEMIETEGGFEKPERAKDLSGIERVVKAQRKWKVDSRKWRVEKK
ncbi:MAG: peptide chain release factor N(5)-glutamine methyltransferase [Thermodesulfobacteriota bacterium]|nr:peptide chain release factor N(5)-glutamine methyltransferase [Thermodesulfobacteriota bacterium]